MDEKLRDIHTNMRELGLQALRHANNHAHYFSYEGPRWAEFAVLQAAHAAEILIKARICEEHPLLIFSNLSKLGRADKVNLDYNELLENGVTYQYKELPYILWATSGKKTKKYQIILRFRQKKKQYTTLCLR